MALLIPPGQAPRVRPGGYSNPSLTGGKLRACYDWLWGVHDGGAWPDLPPADAPTHCTDHCFLVISPVPENDPNIVVQIGLWEGGKNVGGAFTFSTVNVGPCTSIISVGADGLLSVAPLGVVKGDGSVDRTVANVDVWCEMHRFLNFHA